MGLHLQQQVARGIRLENRERDMFRHTGHTAQRPGSCSKKRPSPLHDANHGIEHRQVTLARTRFLWQARPLQDERALRGPG